MEQKNTNTRSEAQRERREQMIQHITKALQELDDRKLGNIYQLILHIQ
ncbi:MAG: hypothetical protein K2K53_08380 [Oscillospiraceae bacterium]|nr:hypothetical protein [Oscillospiraceae bacterium]